MVVILLLQFWPHFVVGLSAAAPKEQSTLSMLVSFLWRPGKEATKAAAAVTSAATAVLPRPWASVGVTAMLAPSSRLMTLSVPRWGKLWWGKAGRALVPPASTQSEFFDAAGGGEAPRWRFLDLFISVLGLQALCMYRLCIVVSVNGVVFHGVFRLLYDRLGFGISLLS